MTRPWSGVFPAAVTHFRDDQPLDIPATLTHLGAMLAAGVHGFILLGTVGENCSLESAEMLEALRATVNPPDDGRSQWHVEGRPAGSARWWASSAEFGLTPTEPAFPPPEVPGRCRPVRRLSSAFGGGGF